MPNRDEQDERNNALIVAGAVMMMLHQSGRFGEIGAVPLNGPVSFSIEPDFMQSPYIITIRRDASGDTS